MGKREILRRVAAAIGARLVRSGRSPEDLGREFEPSAQAIRNRVKQWFRVQFVRVPSSSLNALGRSIDAYGRGATDARFSPQSHQLFTCEKSGGTPKSASAVML